ncbi:MAG: O-antigen ligase family protein [Pseudomonadota bacterium]
MMGLFIFLNPFPHITTIKEFIFYPTAFAVLVLIATGKIDFSFKSPLSLPFALFVSWALLNLFFALDKPGSIHDFLAHLIKYIFFYYVLINFFSSKKGLDTLSWLIIVPSTIFSIVSLSYFYIVLQNPLSTRFGNNFTDSATNIIGFTIVFAFILAVHHILSDKTFYLKTACVFCLFPLFAASILTQSRGTILALILSSFVLLINHKKTLFCFSFMILFLVWINPAQKRIAEYDSYHVRLGTFYYSVEMIKDYPVIGSGFSIDTFRDPKIFNPDEYMKRIPDKYRKQPHGIYWPHNMLLSMGVRVGLIGLVLFLYLLFVPAKMCWHLIRSGGDEYIKNWGICLSSVYIMLCVHGLFNPIFTHFVDVIFYTILSMITILWRLNQDDAHSGGQVPFSRKCPNG